MRELTQIEQALLEAVNAAKSKGWTISGLAEAAGVQQAGLSRFVNGQRPIEITTADKLATFFQVKLSPAKIPNKTRD